MKNDLFVVLNNGNITVCILITMGRGNYKREIGKELVTAELDAYLLDKIGGGPIREG